MTHQEMTEKIQNWAEERITDIEDSCYMGHITESSRDELVASYRRILHELAWLNAELPDESHLV